jgi:hypothetical protein
LNWVTIASFAATLITIQKSTRRTVVTSGQDTIALGYHGTNAGFHTVRAAGGNPSKPHEVGIEARPNKLFIFEIVVHQLIMKLSNCVVVVVGVIVEPAFDAVLFLL